MRTPQADPRLIRTTMPRMSPQKNPHARALGKLGGKVGWLARTPAKIKAAQINGRLGGRPVRKKSG